MDLLERLEQDDIAEYALLVASPQALRGILLRDAGIKAPDSSLIAARPDSSQREKDAQLLLQRQSKRGATIDETRRQLDDPLYQGIAMLLDNRADGMIAGSLRPTADIVRAAIQSANPIGNGIAGGQKQDREDA